MSRRSHIANWPLMSHICLCARTEPDLSIIGQGAAKLPRTSVRPTCRQFADIRQNERP